MAIAMLVAATALQGISIVREGYQASTAAKYNAAVSEAEAEAVRKSAAFESETLTKQSELEQAKIEREKAKTLATQRAAYAKAGVRIEEGSPLEVQADTAAQYELDLATERYNLATGLETIRYESETKQAQLRAEAQYQRSLSKAYKTSAYLKAGSTLLTGAYSAGSKAGYWGTKAKGD